MPSKDFLKLITHPQFLLNFVHDILYNFQLYQFQFRKVDISIHKNFSTFYYCTGEHIDLEVHCKLDFSNQGLLIPPWILRNHISILKRAAAKDHWHPTYIQTQKIISPDFEKHKQVNNQAKTL